MTTRKKSSTSKGARLELEAQKILEHLGYICHRARAVTYQRDGQWRRESTDIFGVFDILAWPSAISVGGIRCLAVQVCTATQRAPHKRKIEAWIEKNAPRRNEANPAIVLASRRERKPWRLEERRSAGWVPMSGEPFLWQQVKDEMRERAARKS